MLTSSGIMFLMYKFDRLLALVYIRKPLRHRDGESEGRTKRRPSAAKSIIRARAPKDPGPNRPNVWNDPGGLRGRFAAIRNPGRRGECGRTETDQGFYIGHGGITRGPTQCTKGQSTGRAQGGNPKSAATTESNTLPFKRC